LLELAKQPNIQHKLRKEIRRTEASIKARGGRDFEMKDLDGMHYLMAVIKVGIFINISFLL
jgi:hypothetical protein